MIPVIGFITFEQAAMLGIIVIGIIVVIMIADRKYGNEITRKVFRRAPSLPVGFSVDNPPEVVNVATVAIQAGLEEMGVFADIYLGNDYNHGDNVVHLLLCSDQAVRLDKAALSSLEVFASNFIASELYGLEVSVVLNVAEKPPWATRS